VGSGPFIFSRLQVLDPDEGRSIVYMEKNPAYVKGAPKLDRFQLHIFKDSSAIHQAFIRQEINAGVDLTSAELKNISEERPTSIIYQTLISDGMYAFMRNDAPEFSDPVVRKAFVLGTDRMALIDRLHGYASRLDGPLTLHQLPSALQKRQASFDNAQAAALLEQAGWKLDGQKRVKDGVPLEIDLVSVQSGDYPVIVDELKQQWGRLEQK